MRAKCRYTAVAWTARPRCSNWVPSVYKSLRTVVLALRPLSSAKRCSKLSSSRAVSVPTGRGGFGRRDRRRDPGPARPQEQRAAPAQQRKAREPQPGAHINEPSEQQVHCPIEPKPTIAAISPNLRMQ